MTFAGTDRVSVAAGELDEILPVVYGELRALARQLFQGQPADHTLRPTALVHEAYLRLARQQGNQRFTREEFLAAAARMIRYILTDHARSRHTAKRGGGRRPAPLEQNDAAAPQRSLDLLALDEALDKLATIDAPKAKLIELRYFGGLSVEQTAQILNTSVRSLYREWELARAWLQRELEGDRTHDA